MNLQWLRNGNCTRTGIRGAGLALAALMISTSLGAWAQVTPRTQVSAQNESGSATRTVFTARVADISGSPVSSGIVSFETAKGSLGSAVVEHGTASLHVDTLPAGASSVSAVYHGEGDYGSSSASVSAQADSAASLPDFSITIAPSSLSLTPGQYGDIAITITPINGFSEMVTLSCSEVPSASTCAFSPTGVTPVGGAAATSILQVQTQGPSGTLTQLRNGSGAEHIALAILLPGALALLGFGALRRGSGLAALRMMGLVALLAASGLGLSSCSQRYNYLNKPPAANPGIAAGTYTITIAAYANNGASVTSHTLNFTLTVK